jgi:glycerol kinase
VTDVTNASRTLLMDLRRCEWDALMCETFGVPAELLPRIVASAGRVARSRGAAMVSDGTPIAALAGDQHAALFGQGCFERGAAKCTYGTGAFVLVNTGAAPIWSRFGLLSTVAWQIGPKPVYALEGSCFVAGAAVQWLRDGLGVIEHSLEIEALARQVESTGGVVFVPALAGLGAPHWDPEARGLICGITRGTTRAHLARATLEAVAHQVEDLLSAMAQDLGGPVMGLRVDGGAAANDLLLQMQSDLSEVRVERPGELESTARGAACLAAVGAELCPPGSGALIARPPERTFVAQMGDSERESNRRAWCDAVRRVRGTGVCGGPLGPLGRGRNNHD